MKDESQSWWILHWRFSPKTKFVRCEIHERKDFKESFLNSASCSWINNKALDVTSYKDFEQPFRKNMHSGEEDARVLLSFFVRNKRF